MNERSDLDGIIGIRMVMAAADEWERAEEV